MISLYVKSKKKKFIETDQTGGCQRQGIGCWGKLDEGGQKVLTSSNEMTKSWGCHVQHGDQS